MKRFDGQIAIITGASRGIGLSIAQRLVDEGACVVITGRKYPDLETAAAGLGDESKVLAISGNAADDMHQQDVVDRTLEAFGRIDMLVNNIGVNPVFGPMVDLDLKAARKILEVNNLAALSWIQRVYKAWLSEHGGAIVNVASVTGIRPSPGIGMYGSSKSMLMHMTEELAVELGPTIRVNAVAPGVVRTRFASALYEGREDEVADAYPLKRIGTPSDVSGVVAFLLSQDAAWVTGQSVVIDGGLTLAGGLG